MSMLEVLIQFNIWQALYAVGGTVEQVGLEAMLTYVVINRLIASFTSGYISSNIGEKVLSGEIVGDFIRPINIKLYLIFDHLGSALYDTAFNFIPVSIVTILFGAFLLPSSLLHGVMFVISLILGIILMYLLNYAIGLLTFWFKTYSYTHWLMRAMTTLFAGTVIPLWFYPDFLKNVAMCLPFRYISFEPIAIYLGQTTARDIVFTIAMQIMWIIVVYFIGLLLWKKAEKRVVIQGG